MEPVALTPPPWSHTEGAKPGAPIPGTRRSKVVAIVGRGRSRDHRVRHRNDGRDQVDLARRGRAGNGGGAGDERRCAGARLGVVAVSPASPSSPTAAAPASAAMAVPPLMHDTAATPAKPGEEATPPPVVHPLLRPLQVRLRMSPRRSAPGAPAAPPPAVSPQAAPRQPASGCNPNYYFDKDGTKHFKPECF